jgi:2'-5' RNA ligase
MKHMRLFIGIQLALEVTQQLVAYTNRLKHPDDDLRWSAPDSWHITLQFLGNTSPSQYECVTSGLRAVWSKQFSVELRDTGFFDRAGIFYLDVPPTPQLAALQKQVTTATHPCGFNPEGRPYHPHITLARNKAHAQGLLRLKPNLGTAPKFSPFTAHEFLLYESHLDPRGSRYEVRERFPLN